MRRRFVEEAPEQQRQRREIQWTLFEIHHFLVRLLFNGHSVRVWLDGGFLTHKDWARPSDIDVVYLVPVEVFDRALSERGLALWTLHDVHAKLGRGGPSEEIEVLRPGFGFIDAYIAPDTPVNRATWADQWSTVKGPDGHVTEDRKGFVEVIENV
ncbi:hypothetical protein [Corynebacterium sp. TAE3-ERU2]|uniref:DUF6932 family protein n=1 Tax=Corynebacterium sp. TAE3-ERU2 TaxID=2849497 RepID=UPI001C44774A|nr:hypothetical protein [Corynebacterium sp. TAE3-ERU2]MBV7302913.1 hypothetical protein [Corynebacterium sp. TAE3-ERU2]